MAWCLGAVPTQIGTIESPMETLQRSETMPTVLVLISVIAWALSAHAAEVLVHSRETILGRDRQADLDFSAVAQEPHVVRVEIQRP
jgi:hypothetical protein